MALQLRVFRIEEGKVRQFADEWSRTVLPLRTERGFTVRSAWVSDEDDLFTWLLEYDGDFDAADEAYYASAERDALDPDPRRLIEEVLVATFVDQVVP